MLTWTRQTFLSFINGSVDSISSCTRSFHCSRASGTIAWKVKKSCTVKMTRTAAGSIRQVRSFVHCRNNESLVEVELYAHDCARYRHKRSHRRRGTKTQSRGREGRPDPRRTRGDASRRGHEKEAPKEAPERRWSTRQWQRRRPDTVTRLSAYCSHISSLWYYKINLNIRLSPQNLKLIFDSISRSPISRRFFWDPILICGEKSDCFES